MQGGSDGSTGASIQLYREVHKHAYLRHITSQNAKKSSGEQYWVVFCVHCDTAPYLEFYSTQATSTTHQPLWRMSLAGTTSVSGALVPQGRLYRLTLVTRESGITLAAATWDDMKDWVDTLRAKLREMKILGPGENLYSKPPEQLVRNRAPTRDPTSPLPPPPPGPAVYVPGTEIPARGQSEDTSRPGDINRSTESSNRSTSDSSTRTPNHESSRTSGEFTRSAEHSSLSQDNSLRSNNDISPSSSDSNTSRSQDEAAARQRGQSHHPTSPSPSYISERNAESSGSHVNTVVDSVQRISCGEPSNSGIQSVVSSDGREINRLHVSANQGGDDVSRIEVTADSNIVISQPYEALMLDNRSRSRGNRYENHTVTIEGSSSSHCVTANDTKSTDHYVPKITSENVSKMKDFTKVKSKPELEVITKVCKDGGLILYNDSLETDQRSFLSANPEQWDDLNAALLDNLCAAPCEDDFVNNPPASGGSRVAKISGMNVCLVDSLLPNRNTAGSSDDDFLNEFDTIDDNTVKTTGNKDVVNIKRDSKGYTQVDINAKKIEIFKNKLLLPFLGGGSPSTSHSHVVTVSSGGERTKPSPLPRTKLEGANKNVSDVYVSLTECCSSDVPGSSGSGIVLRDSKDRKKVSLNRTSSVPDSIESEHILHTFCGEMVEASKHETGDISLESNVTIISVSNQHHQHNAPSTAIPIVGTQFDFDSTQINKITDNTVSVNNSSEKKYTNVSVTNIDVVPSDDSIELRRKQNQQPSNSGYGHIRHSTNRKPIMDLELTNRNVENKRTSLDSNKSKSGISNLNVISKGLEIPEFKNVKNADASSKRATSTHTRDFYESVFGPFDSNSDVSNRNATIEMSCDKVVVQVPKLFVNIPNSPNTSRRIDNTNNNNHVNDGKKEQQPIKRSDDVFVKSRQIVDVNRDTGTSITAIAGGSSSGQRIRNKEDSDYEFLSWNHQRELLDGTRNTNATTRTNNTENVPRQNYKENVETTNESRNNSNPEHVHEVNGPAGGVKQNPDFANHSKRSGLFTRGLTELNIMSKFRNLSANNRNGSETKALVNNVKQSNDSENCATTSNSANVSGVGNKKNAGERTAFTAKLNNIFYKFSDGKTTAASNSSSPGGFKNRNVENVVRSESSLRRNWSEHNDRTAPPTIIRVPNDAKPLRPRPPALAAVSPRRQPPGQISDVDNRRRSNSLSSARVSSDEINSNQTGVVAHPKPALNIPVMSLREQQVMRLRNEMAHSGGIRLVLSTRDSPEQAVALVDIYSGVWIAGWKQRSHPLLYNALHIGDRLHSVDGCVVSSARQARRAIQNNAAHKVEIIIKRLPHGRVYALKRDSDRQDLGLVVDCANITGIVPNSPAHRAGVPASGTLTEVNGRPLNLLLKKGSTQVKDRLTSIGREVSVLVQPTEFVSLLRTALKAVRGNKDYIVQ